MSKPRGLEELMELFGKIKGARSGAHELASGENLAAINENGIEMFKDLIDFFETVSNGKDASGTVQFRTWSSYLNEDTRLYDFDLNFRVSCLVPKSATTSDGDPLEDANGEEVRAYLEKRAKKNPRRSKKRKNDDE